MGVEPKIGVVFYPQNGWFISWKTQFFNGWFGGVFPLILVQHPNMLNFTTQKLWFHWPEIQLELGNTTLWLQAPRIQGSCPCQRDPSLRSLDVAEWKAEAEVNRPEMTCKLISAPTAQIFSAIRTVTKKNTTEVWGNSGPSSCSISEVFANIKYCFFSM